MECVVCGIGISKKARTCSSKCRQIASRRSVTEKCDTVTVDRCDKVIASDLELCRYCSADLPALAKPRRHPGACLSCASKAPSKCSLDALGDTVWAGSERPKDERGIKCRDHRKVLSAPVGLNH